MTTIPFDLRRFTRSGFGGHGGRLNLSYRAHGDDWVELAMPWHDELVGDAASGVLASGPIIAMIDVATSLAVWTVKRAFVPHATLDLRVDVLRPTTAGRTVIGRGECYRVARSISFIRGQAHQGDPADPVAQVTGTYMNLDAQP